MVDNRRLNWVLTARYRLCSRLNRAWEASRGEARDLRRPRMSALNRRRERWTARSARHTALWDGAAAATMGMVLAKLGTSARRRSRAPVSSAIHRRAMRTVSTFSDAQQDDAVAPTDPAPGAAP